MTVDVALLMQMFARRKAGAERRQAAGFPCRAGLARQLILRLPARQALGVAGKIVERVFQRADAAQQGMAVSMGSSRFGTGTACGNTGSMRPGTEMRGTACSLLQSCDHSSAQPKSCGAKRFKRIDERKCRKALLFFFQSLLQLVSQPGRKGARCSEPQLHDNADGGDDDEPAARRIRRDEEGL